MNLLGLIIMERSISTGYGDYERLRDIDTNPSNLAKRTHANIALLFNSGMQAISSLISYLEHRKHIQTLYDVQVYPEIAALIGGDGISIENAEFKAYAYLFDSITMDGKWRDMAGIIARIHAAGGLAIVDNTFGALNSSPIDSGADFVIESLTKYITGHLDGMSGLLAVYNDRITEMDMIEMTEYFQHGGMLATKETRQRVTYGMETFDLRMARIEQNARTVTRKLAEMGFHAAYPQIGGVIWIHGVEKEIVNRFSQITGSDTFGLNHTTWCYLELPHILRLSIGIEPVEIILKDIEGML